MDMTSTTSAMSKSLLARNVYCVCFPERDGFDTLRGELAGVRKKFFTGGRKSVAVGKKENIKGFEGKLRGKLTRHGLYWKKTAGKVVLEEAFDQRNGYVVVRRDFRGIIISRTFFDRNHLWLKSEYYEPWNTANAQVIFKPGDAADLIQRFDREPGNKPYRSVELHPLPYLAGTAEQSILNARFGEPSLIVSTTEGEFCYCPKKDAQARKRALDDIKDGTIVLMPAWEVKDGSLAGEGESEETAISFTSLEEYAKIEPGQEAPPQSPAPAAPLPSQEAEEFTPEPEEEASETALEEAERGPVAEAAGETGDFSEEPSETAAETAVKNGLESMGYRGAIRNGRITGHGRTEQQNGLTTYDGEYLDGKRNGFGSYYYKDGSLCYAGSWKDDKKDGLGVSFRESDRALHIAKWKDGQPGDFVSLFDKDGNLRYSGRIENGKKQGVGVSINQADGTVFVGKWEDGKPTGLGSSFDRDGNLLYYGGWKDGKRSGHGTEFDGSGGIVFDGEWKDGKYHNGILYQKLPQEGKEDEYEPSFDL